MGLRRAKPFGLFEKGIELYIDAFETAKFLEERDHLTKCHEFRAGIISHFLYIEREENDFSAYIFHNDGSLGDKSYIHYKALALPIAPGKVFALSVLQKSQESCSVQRIIITRFSKKPMSLLAKMRR